MFHFGRALIKLQPHVSPSPLGGVWSREVTWFLADNQSQTAEHSFGLSADFFCRKIPAAATGGICIQTGITN